MQEKYNDMAKKIKSKARFDAKTKRSTFAHPVRPPALTPDVGAPSAYGMGLADKKGITGAAHILYSNYYDQIKKDH